MKKTTLILLVLLIAAAAMIAGCAQQAQPAPQPTAQPTPVPTAAGPVTVKVTSTSAGMILTDAQGKSLYYFANDVPSKGTSACNGQCAALWPPYNVGTVSVSSPLDPADFNSITRADGTKQTTWYGWPLYYYSRDAKSGDVNGENFLNVWFTLKPDQSVMVEHTPALGLYLTDISGMTLYTFAKDTTGTSACNGACIALWPPFNSTPIEPPTSVKIADFGTVNRADGLAQLSYMGKPLYYYSRDANPGDTNGQGFNNLWSVANVSGVSTVVPPTAVPSVVPTAVPATTKTLSPAGSNYNGGGY
jgi:predicted lipoprotein with Yx(FWY)xxD motif